jgi:hypothetical protein
VAAHLLNKLKTYLITKHNMDNVVYLEDTTNVCCQRNKWMTLKIWFVFI